MSANVLLLAGTREARELAQLLAEEGIRAEASLAGATRVPAKLPIATRSGGFGGETQQEEYMQNNGFTHVVDATHPFAARITKRSLALARNLGLPYLRLERPAWEAAPDDRWIEIETPAQASAHIPPEARVFMAVGPGSVEAFSGLAGAGRLLFCRYLDATAPEDLPALPELRFVQGAPGASAEEEARLFERLRIDWLVAKNSGGPARAKLDAARTMGLPAVMLRRPALSVCPRVETAREALGWLRETGA